MVEDTPWQQFFLSSLSLFGIILFGFTNCMIVMKDFVFLRMVDMETGNSHIFSYHDNCC